MHADCLTTCPCNCDSSADRFSIHSLRRSSRTAVAGCRTGKSSWFVPSQLVNEKSFNPASDSPAAVFLVKSCCRQIATVGLDHSCGSSRRLAGRSKGGRGGGGGSQASGEGAAVEQKLAPAVLPLPKLSGREGWWNWTPWVLLRGHRAACGRAHVVDRLSPGASASCPCTKDHIGSGASSQLLALLRCCHFLFQERERVLHLSISFDPRPSPGGGKMLEKAGIRALM